MIIKYNTYNESVRDQMKPKSEEEIRKKLKNLLPNLELLKGAEFDILWAVEDAIERGADIGCDAHHALAMAIQNNNLDIIKVLVNNDNLNQEQLNWSLKNACKFSGVDVIEFLLKQGANPNAVAKFDLYQIPFNRSNEVSSLLKKYGRGYGFNKNKKVDESVRDLMKPKSEEEIKQSLKLSNKTLEEKLFLACENGMLWLIKEVQHAFNRINHVNEPVFGVDLSVDNNRAIKIASYNKHYDIVEYLLKYKCVKDKLSTLDKMGYELGIYRHRKSKTNESVRDLMKPKTEEEIRKSLDYKTPNERLILGTSKNLFWLVKQSIEEGANVDYKAEYGRTALIWASMMGNLEIVKYLVENGAHISIKSDSRFTALDYALKNENFDVINFLKNYTIKGKIKKLIGFNESVKDMMKPKSKEEIEKIIKKLPKQTKDEYLQVECSKGNIEMVKLLIKYGADITNRWIYGYDTLSLATKKGHIDIVKFLLDNDANIHINRDFPLVLAVLNGELEIVKLLIDRGANVHTRDDIALYYAESEGFTEIEELLKKQKS